MLLASCSGADAHSPDSRGAALRSARDRATAALSCAASTRTEGAFRLATGGQGRGRTAAAGAERGEARAEPCPDRALGDDTQNRGGHSGKNRTSMSIWGVARGIKQEGVNGMKSCACLALHRWPSRIRRTRRRRLRYRQHQVTIDISPHPVSVKLKTVCLVKQLTLYSSNDTVIMTNATITIIIKHVIRIIRT